ncbi:hypothetical protein BC938DRAFT_483066 [Jimgerdemannia flammicorona]|uniref:Uncharacterized protein n=1 Tax=Jimgerdemannia flammicorona TaxID=994334 RepID=A0A433QCW0_9FUNG|nr:hypothetical protein BC938DRAFT_483066 [Jimgerdemannia flammicorona]
MAANKLSSKRSAKRSMAASREDEESDTSEDGDSAHPMAAGKNTENDRSNRPPYAEHMPAGFGNAMT